jgi:uncharacterized protein (DUF3820 family)
MRTFLIVALCTAGLSACAPVRPNIRVGDATIQGLPTLLPTECQSGGFGAPLPAEYRNRFYDTVPPRGQLGGVLAILLSAVVTQGVDYLGERLKRSSEERPRELEALLNVDDGLNEPGPPVPVAQGPGQFPVGCFDFQRGDLLIRFAMLPVDSISGGNRVPNTHVYFVIVGIRYGEAVNTSRSGVRGVALGFHIRKPGSEEVSQTVSLGNIEVGAELSIPFEGNPLISGYMDNPFIAVSATDNARPQLFRSLPFTMRVKLSEIRNANELAGFASGVVDHANDGLTAALIRALGIRNDDDDDEDEAGGDAPAPGGTGQPPGTGAGTETETPEG